MLSNACKQKKKEMILNLNDFKGTQWRNSFESEIYRNVRIVQHVHIVWGGGKDYTMADM